MSGILNEVLLSASSSSSHAVLASSDQSGVCITIIAIRLHMQIHT